MDCPSLNLEALYAIERKQKAQFVMRLSEAYRTSVLEVEDIRYFDLGDTELVRIRYTYGDEEFINVSIDSIACIGKEIATQLHTGDAFGLIRDTARCQELVREKLREKWRDKWKSESK